MDIKRTRFFTWDTEEISSVHKVKNKHNENEQSISLDDDKDDYYSGFKNYSLKTYDGL